MGDLKNHFEQSTLSSVAHRLGDVAAQNQFTIIGDPDHREHLIYDLIGEKQTMGALANAGVKHLGLEAFTPGDELVLKAYHNGRLSDRTMEFMATRVNGLTLVRDVFKMDDTQNNKSLFDMVKSANDLGIRVHGLNGYEGMFDPKVADKAFKFLAIAKENIAFAIEDDPKFFDLNKKQQNEFVVKALYDSGLRDRQVKTVLETIGLRRSVGEIPNVDDNLIVKRIEQDDYVAERMIKLAGGEKMAAIYGRGHFMRMEGDVDYFLQSKAVVGIFSDKAKNEAGEQADLVEIGKKHGIYFKDKGDYSLDFKTGTWTDEKNGIISKIDLPPSQLQEIIPAIQQQKSMPEIRF